MLLRSAAKRLKGQGRGRQHEPACGDAVAHHHVVQHARRPAGRPARNHARWGPLCSSAHRARYGSPAVRAPRRQSSSLPRTIDGTRLILQIPVGDTCFFNCLKHAARFGEVPCQRLLHRQPFERRTPRFHLVGNRLDELPPVHSSARGTRWHPPTHRAPSRTSVNTFGEPTPSVLHNCASSLADFSFRLAMAANLGVSEHSQTPAHRKRATKRHCRQSRSKSTRHTPFYFSGGRA